VSSQELSRQLEAFHDWLPQSAANQTMRREALDRFSQAGLPTRRLEAWRYTDLSSLASKPFRFVAPQPEAEALERAAEHLGRHGGTSGRSRTVFVDGRWAESLSSSRRDPGVFIDAAVTDLVTDAPGTALSALNTAFAAERAVVEVTQRVTEPIELVFIGTGRQLAPQLKLNISLAADAGGIVILRFMDVADADESWLNLVLDIEQERGSELALYRLQAHGDDSYQTTLCRARLAENARLASTNIELGGRLVRNEHLIALAGDGAAASVSCLTLTRDDQHADSRIVVDHEAPHTTSRQVHRAILAGKSRSVFNGKVIVREQAQQIDARQRSDSLLLSSGAEADVKPELEIYADQVVCSHGATVGELDEEQLFYLRARGIDETEARAVLTRAFADTILERIDQPAFRGDAGAAVRARLRQSREAT
jgi:Fe-S cluster assembly protein SufD